MNVIEILSKELEDKDWDESQVARYLYLRSCQLFSYDPRYNASESLSNYEKIQFNILNRSIDLENVEDNTAVCFSHSDQIYTKLLMDFLSLTGLAGVSTIFNLGDQKIRAYAPPDFIRAKMHCSTLGYQPSIILGNKKKSTNISFKESLEKIDKEIGYIEDRYFDQYLETIKNNLELEFSNTGDLLLLSKIKEIKRISDSFYFRQSYSDSSACISLLIEFLLSQNEHFSMIQVPLFIDHQDKDWEFIKIYRIDLENDTIFYILDKDQDEYQFHETTFQTIKSYADNAEWKGMKKEMIFR